MKTCSKCNHDKDSDHFSIGRRTCRECVKSNDRVRGMTDEAKARRKRYASSERGLMIRKELHRRWKKTDKGKACNMRYKQRVIKTPEWKEKQRVYSRKQNLGKYGLTEDAYKSMLIGQAFGCAICGSERGSSHRKNLFVDHCHRTKQVRGLLCGRCNFIIGQAEDNPELLARMIDYVVGGGIPR